jgi:peptidoglycan/xylan/chitin deacetylase (PgdA/CDA1 family)
VFETVTPTLAPRRLRRLMLVLLTVAGVVLLWTLAPARAAAADTVVSLEFDDATNDQDNVASSLAARGMHGTFYVNSGVIGQSFHLNWSQVDQIAAGGNEIAGHGVDHRNMLEVQAQDVNEARRIVCNDRVTLLNKGYEPTNYAYPYGAFDDTTKQIAEDCGYNSAREAGGLGCQGCPDVESIPPPDPFDTRTTTHVNGNTTLNDIKAMVTTAEAAGGGWVQIVFHHFCDSCDFTYRTSQATFNAFLDWLQARSASGTVVKTVKEVIGGPVKPAVNGPAPTPPPGTNMLRNPSLEDDSNHDGTPDCWLPQAYGVNTANWSRTNDAHSGSFAERLNVTSFTTGGQRLFSWMDLGSCAPPGTPGNNYTFSAYYKSTTAPRFEVYIRNSIGNWTWWMTTGPFNPSSAWAKASFTTPPLPDGVTGVSIGFGLLQGGSMTVDDYSMVDRGVLPAPANVLPNAGVETIPTGGGDPTCWARTRAGGNNGVWAHTSDAHGGANAEQATITSYTDGDVKLVSQQDSVLVNPSGLTATAQTTGGSLQAGTYYYVITAINTRGETLRSNEVSATSAGGGTDSVRLAWGAINGATGYRIYRAGSPGAETLLASVGAVTTFTDTGAAAPGTQTPPSSNTAIRVTPCAPVPVVGHSYQGSAWYKSSAGASLRIIIYYRDAAGNWIFWKNTPVPPSTTWTQASTISDPVPPGATAVGMAMSMLSVGTLTVDDLSLGDSTAVTDPPECNNCDAVAPSSSASSPAFSVSPSLTVSWTAADDPGGSGLAKVDLYARGPGEVGFTKVASDPSPSTSGSFPYLAAVDGSYDFYTLATDTAGNSQAAPVSAQTTTVVDGVAPSSQASSPALTRSSTVTVQYLASDGGAGLARVDLYAKAPGASSYSLAGSDASGTGTISYTPSAGDGSYSFFTVATDRAGNVESAPADADSATLVDRAAPQSAASAPGTADTKPITVSYTAADDSGASGLASVDLYVRKPGDSSYAKVATDGAPAASGSFSYTPDGGNGSYAFYTVAHDQAGNDESAPGSPDATTVYSGDPVPDTTAPQSSAAAPATVVLAPIAVTYTAADEPGGTGLAKVDLYVRTPGATVYTKVATDATPGATGSFSYTPAGAGSYSFYTVATDIQGNAEAAPVTPDATTNYAPDTTRPTSSASSPAYRTNTSVSVSYTSSDSGGSGLASVELWVRVPGTTSFGKVATNTAPPASGSFAYTAAGDGAYGFYTIAVDTAGNRENAPSGPDSTTTVDTVAPNPFQITEPAEYLRGTITLALAGAAPGDTGSGLASIQYQYLRDGSAGSWAAACTATRSPWTCNWNTANVTDGAYSVRALGSDRAGNGTLSTNTVAGRNVDNTRPVTAGIAADNLSGGIRGLAETGDAMTFTYSERMQASTILPGWTGASTAVQVRLINATNDRVEVWRADGSARIDLADKVTLGGNYVPTSGAIFAGTMAQDGARVVVTLGARTSGAVNTVAVTGGTIVWDPGPDPLDLAGNKVTNASFSAAGPAF